MRSVGFTAYVGCVFATRTPSSFLKCCCNSGGSLLNCSCNPSDLSFRLAFGQYMNLPAVDCPQPLSPASEFCRVMLNVTGSADPSNFQWLAVIVMVPVGSRLTATFTGLSDRESFAGFDASQNLRPILWIVCVTLLAIRLNSLAVALVEGSTERLCKRKASGRTELTA